MSDRDRIKPDQPGPAEDRGQDGAVPTGGALAQLLERFGPAGVQRIVQRRLRARGDQAGNGSPEGVQKAAERGIAGTASTLPHADAIQKSFGKHDVSGIRAHSDGAATAAADAMGAEAFATGDRVAFARAPDLHTAAHEAAHVVQQRGGVQLKGGVGEEGDAHERHADAVADRVVRGESSEALLDQLAGGGSRPASAPNRSGALQRKIKKPGGGGHFTQLAELEHFDWFKTLKQEQRQKLEHEIGSESGKDWELDELLHELGVETGGGGGSTAAKDGGKGAGHDASMDASSAASAHQGGKGPVASPSPASASGAHAGKDKPAESAPATASGDGEQLADLVVAPSQAHEPAAASSSSTLPAAPASAVPASAPASDGAPKNGAGAGKDSAKDGGKDGGKDGAGGQDAAVQLAERQKKILVDLEQLDERLGKLEKLVGGVASAKPSSAPAARPAAASGAAGPLAEWRAKVTGPATQRAFDDFVRALKEKGQPDERIAQALAAKEKKKGTLEAAFQDDVQRAAAASKAAEAAEERKPKGPVLEELLAIESAFQKSIEELAQAESIPGVKGSITRLKGDLDFLAKLLDGRVKLEDAHVIGLRANLGGVMAEWNVAKREPGLVGIGQKLDGGALGDVDLDVLAGEGKVWVEVKNENPASVESNWDDRVKAGAGASSSGAGAGAGEDVVKYRGHKNQITRLIEAAAAGAKPKNEKMPKVRAEAIKVVFTQGLPKSARVMQDLQEMSKLAESHGLKLIVEET
jgi:hypothetical protein